MKRIENSRPLLTNDTIKPPGVPFAGNCGRVARPGVVFILAHIQARRLERQFLSQAVGEDEIKIHMALRRGDHVAAGSISTNSQYKDRLRRLVEIFEEDV
jgi:hypothetical protein